MHRSLEHIPIQKIPYAPLTILIIIFSCFPSAGFAEYFSRFETENTISNNWIRCIHEDDTGYMWFGTMSGLNRFDGLEYEIYHPVIENGSKVHTSINFISKQSRQKLWIGTAIGLFSFDTQRKTFTRKEIFGDLPVSSILTMGSDGLLVSTVDGLLKMQGDQVERIHVRSKVSTPSNWQSEQINMLYRDSKSRIWIGTKTGLFVTDETLNHWQRIQIPGQTQEDTDFDVLQITEDAEQDIWFSTSRKGFYWINSARTDLVAEKKGSGSIVGLLVDSKDRIWIGHSGRGGLEVIEISKLKNEEGETKGITFFNDKHAPKSISDDSIFCIYEDSKQNTWIGTFSGGVNFLSGSKKNFAVYTTDEIDSPYHLSNNLVNCFYEDEHSVWIGTEGGLNRLDKTTGRFTNFSKFDPPYGTGDFPVFSFCPDIERNTLWIGTWSGGVFKYDYSNEQFTQYTSNTAKGELNNENIFSIHKGPGPYLWLGTIGGGINRIDLQTEVFENFSSRIEAIGASVNKIIQVEPNLLLISAYGHVATWDLRTDVITTIEHAQITGNGAVGGNINEMFIDSKGNIWCGGDMGLELFDLKTKHFTQVRSEDQSPSLAVAAITEDDKGNLWLTTNEGLIKFVNGTAYPTPVEFLYTDQNEGLPNNHFKDRSIFTNSEGVIYAGTSAGFVRFDPEEIEYNLTSPTAVLNDIFEFRSSPDSGAKFVSIRAEIDETNTLKLSYHQNHLQFSFALLNYINPKQNRFRYRMVGFDTDWLDSTNYNRATYTNLSPGKYRFEVTGQNNDGINCLNSAWVDIVIYPPWWLTLQFRLFSLTFFILLLAVLIHRKFAAQKKLNQILQVEVSHRTAELRVANEELEEHRDHLEELVFDRTQELQRAKEKAEESDRLKSSFLSNLSHEIRTPMNAILGFSNLLSDPELDDQERSEFIQLIEHNSTSLLTIVEDILDMSMIEAQQTELQIHEFTLDELLEDLHSFYQLKNDKDIKITLSLPEKQAKVDGDPNRIRQVLNNLLDNALKFTSKGEIEFGYTEENQHVKVFVKDTGIGIEAHEMESIFKRFYKVEKENAELYAGTGIGLAISERLIAMHNQKIEVESTVGEGSVFSFKLPLSQ